MAVCGRVGRVPVCFFSGRYRPRLLTQCVRFLLDDCGVSGMSGMSGGLTGSLVPWCDGARCVSCIGCD
jgi:hypothetical protein